MNLNLEVNNFFGKDAYAHQGFKKKPKKFFFRKSKGDKIHEKLVKRRLKHRHPWTAFRQQAEVFEDQKFLLIRSDSEFRKAKKNNQKRKKKARPASCCPEKRKSYDQFRKKNINSLKQNAFLRSSKKPEKPKLFRRPFSAAPNYTREKIDKLDAGFFGIEKNMLVPNKCDYFKYVENNDFETIRKKKWYYMKNLQDTSEKEKEQEVQRLMQERLKKERLATATLEDSSPWWKEKQFKLTGVK